MIFCDHCEWALDLESAVRRTEVVFLIVRSLYLYQLLMQIVQQGVSMWNLRFK